MYKEKMSFSELSSLLFPRTTALPSTTHEQKNPTKFPENF